MIRRGDTEARSKLLHEHLTEQVIGPAIEVHREIGPGLMESAYEECLCHELHRSKSSLILDLRVSVVK
jgi:GxxExxY protein